VFAESAWSRKTVGDVDVLFHEGLYHLFHLVLPNHDFVAHAISDNGLNWRRIDNALFIGNPGSWDDLMLWTMHVSADPNRPGGWRMFYTGLTRRDQGRKQRIGLALSDDLYTWRKADSNWQDLRGPTDPELVKAARAKLPTGFSDNIRSRFDETSCFPLQPDPEHYEASVNGERGWISFRDPFFYCDQEQSLLLAAARTSDGPLARRGCVAAMEEVTPNCFQARPPLFAPEWYDDIEVPNLMKVDDEFYLIGSIREDAKIRYWNASSIDGPWRNYYDNVLLPAGNYAGRVCRDDSGLLLWNFYTEDTNLRTANNLMPPPKRLIRTAGGQLRATTFEQIERRVIGSLDPCCFHPLKEGSSHQSCNPVGRDGLRIASEQGFQAFVFDAPVECFSLSAKITMTGIGKCGLLYRVDPHSRDGYYVSLDLMKGVAQLRAWGTGPKKSGEKMMQFKSLQSGYWYDATPREIRIKLICFGSYHELSINDAVTLSLADTVFADGLLGFYVETAELQIDELSIQRLQPPTQSDEHLATG
jgi:beta-fructofuranosidase